MSEDKNKKDYSNGKIYCIRNTINDDIYIGSTCQSLSKRMALHRYDSTTLKKQNRKIYKLMTEYGSDKFYIELIEDYPCENIYQLQRKEGETIRDMKPSLNMVVAGRTPKEYYEQNVELIKQKRKEYYEQNAEILKQKDKQYYEQNAEILKQKNKEYREQNVEKIKQKDKKYYEQNVEIIKQKRKYYREQNAEMIKQKKKEYYYRKKAEKNILENLD